MGVACAPYGEEAIYDVIGQDTLVSSQITVD